MTPFSLAALISFCLAVINIIWLACAFKETLPEHKRNTDKKSKPVIFELGRIKNLAVRNTCLRVYLFYMVSFSGMEFTLTFLAVERFAYEPLQIMKMFLLIGGTLIFAQGYLVRKFVGKLEKRQWLFWGFIEFLAFGMIALIKDESWFFVSLFLMSTGVAFV